MMMTYLYDYNQILNALAAEAYYVKWRRDNLGEAARFDAHRQAILAGDTPVAPTMTTSYGKRLILTGVMALRLRDAETPPPPVSSVEIGVCASNTICWWSTLNRAAWLDHAKTLGATWVRFDVRDTNPAFKVFADEIRSRGMKTLCTVTPGAGAPNWSNTSFAGTIAAWGIADAIEWGNELNLPNFWGGAPNPSAWRVSNNGAYQAVAGRVPFITAGLSPAGAYNQVGFTADGGNHSINGLNFLEAALKGGPILGDFIGWHPYTQPVRVTGTNPANAWYQMEASTPSVSSLTGKKIWATEFGYQSVVVGDPQQASMLVEGIAAWESLACAGGPIFLYHLIDGQDGAAAALAGYGLYRNGWVEKPAVQAVQAAL